MKTALTVLSSFLVVSVTLGCASRGSSDQAAEPEQLPRGAVTDQNQRMLTLADYLRQVPGVLVVGGGVDTRVEIHGVSSFYLSTEPLYVVDGQPAGYRYAPVAAVVPAQHIDYVRVLKGSEAAIYGVRGGNGVILIVTKK